MPPPTHIFSWVFILKKTIFIKNALILTLSSLVLRFAGIIFKVYVTRIIGSEGVGLYQLIFSFYMLASTFATTGICTAVTRLVSEEVGVGSKKGTIKIFVRSIELTLILALISVAIVFFGAEFIAKNIIGDQRAVSSLKILSISLPFMGISSCIRGYFIALRRATPGALTQLFEQAVRILMVLLLVKKYMQRGLEAACNAVILGDAIAEILTCGLLVLTFYASRKGLENLKGRENPPYGIAKKILHISAPITGGRYLNTALRTGENVLVPKNLAKFHTSSGGALSMFGMIKGMALPILFFPSTLLNSISTLLLPEMAEAVAKNRLYMVKSATERILKLTSLVSFIFGSVFFFCGKNLGLLIYNSREVGYLLCALSPIVPFMYLDSISDGILKGLDQQTFTFRTAISDSVIRIILILIFLPISGMRGFIIIMYFSNALTCFMNVRRLAKVSHAKLKIFKDLIFPLCLSVGVCFIVNSFLKLLPFFGNLGFIAIFAVLSIALYVPLLCYFKVTNIKELLWISR